MRVVIYGAGAIGSVIGGFLARNGTGVVLIGRPGHMAAINKNGLKLNTLDGQSVVRIETVSSPKGIKFTPDDMVCLCVKSQDTEQAVQDLLRVAGDVPVFCCQNGVRNEEIAARYFKRVYGVMVRVGADFLTDGEVTAHHEPNTLFMGCYPRGIDSTVLELAGKLRAAGLVVVVTKDIMQIKWGKLLNNLAVAVNAICDTCEPENRSILNSARQELVSLMREAGIRWLTAEDISRTWPETNLPLRGKPASESKGSTWQSLVRETGKVETEFFNGEVVRLAQRLNREAPINKKIWAICREMSEKHEHPGKFTPAELAEILGIK